MRGAITTCRMSAGLSGRPPLAGWAPFAVVLAVSAALLGFDLGARVLATNDEARFPMMARDLAATGHCPLPETGGVPRLNNPPLHAWRIALSAWPTGVVSQRTAAVRCDTTPVGHALSAISQA